MEISPAPRGACPRVWAPMASGDGLILRVHAPRGGMSAHTLRALTELARQHGNGQLELTRRANLQLRGAREASLPALQAALVRLGLAPADPAAELRQVLLVHPLEGLDPACARLEEAAAQIESALAGLPPHAELPAKFGILLDSGGSVFRGLAADIAVDVRPDQPELAHLRVGGEASLGACWSAQLGAALERLLALVDRETRMRDVVATCGIDTVRAHLDALLVAAPIPPASRRARPPLGFQRGARDWFGVALPFGASDAAAWQTIARLAEELGDGALRLAPGRAVLLPGVRAQDAGRVRSLAHRHGLIADAEDPLLRATACAGAPACAAAHGETRALARRLARDVLPLLGREATLHVSGCAKSCASRGPARITIVRDAAGDKLGFDADAVQVAGSRAIPRAVALQRVKEMAAAGR